VALPIEYATIDERDEVDGRLSARAGSAAANERRRDLKQVLVR